MQAINWARQELARDLTGWRLRVTESRADRVVVTAHQPPVTDIRGHETPAVLLEWVEVDPQVLILSGVVGTTALFRARATGAASREIRARLPTSAPIDLVRAVDASDVVTFEVRLTRTPTFQGDDSFVVGIDLIANGYSPNRVFVSIQPMSASVIAQGHPSGRIAPPRHASASARVHFGQHKGRTYAEVALENPGYLEWMIENNIQGRIPVACARLALGYQPDRVVGTGDRTAAGAVSSPTSVHRAPLTGSASQQPSVSSPSEPRALPDPNRPRGLLGFVRGILGGGKQ